MKELLRVSREVSSSSSGPVLNRVEKALDTVMRCARRTPDKYGERSLSITLFAPIENDDTGVRITERVRHIEENKSATIIDNQMARISR
jgi:hypothetical protein